MKTRIGKYELKRDRAIEAARHGASDLEILELVGISSTTLYNWKNRYPEFKDALDAARVPEVNQELLDKIQRRREKAEKLLDEYLDTGKLETTRFDPDPEGGGYNKIVYRHIPEKWLLERILGAVQVEPAQEYEVRVSMIDPYSEDIEESEETDEY